MTLPHRALSRLRAQEGFTMIIAIGVMFVTSLVLVAAFTVANGDVHSSHRSTLEKQAYYAALAGVQQYEATLQSEPNYWQSCKTIENAVPEASVQSYVVKPVPATGQVACSAEAPFTSMIESKGVAANTFRVRSTGTAGRKGARADSVERTVIATFGVSGFLQFVFFTNYEIEDPGLYMSGASKALAEKCLNKKYETWAVKEKLECHTISFLSGDEIEGPMHTNDTARVDGSAIFGRKGHEPKDIVEMNGGTYGTASGCPSKGGAVYNTPTGCYIKGPELAPPPTDESLEFYVEKANNFEGATHLELKGSEIAVTNLVWSSVTKKWSEVKKTIPWPSNGLLYVQGNKETGCGYEFEPENSDTSTETNTEQGCANVYVHGVYEKSLTVAGANDVIVDGTINPSSVTGKLASSGSPATKPTGTAVLGLIANNYVRVYHPCSGGTNQTGSFKDPWIYAAVLATQHSWIVDNSSCGSGMGKLNVYGAIGQNYRGVVLRGSSGYVKNYEYDDRLATDEPPYFLAPLKAGWKIIRETAQSPG
jgi:Tfp pilus assembly protein PilX